MCILDEQIEPISISYNEYLSLPEQEKEDKLFFIFDLPIIDTIDDSPKLSDNPPIRYRSNCKCCGAPVNDGGRCEYCGVGHQYLD